MLDVETDLLGELRTRVVNPLSRASALAHRSAMQTLTPLLFVQDTEYLMVTTQLAGIVARELGPLTLDLSGDRQTIIAALDLLLTGI